MTGTELADLALTLLAVAIALPLVVFSIEVLAAVWPSRRSTVVPTAMNVRAVVMIPAHNESAGIQGTLQSLLPTLGPHHSLLVIADNCSDETAEIARAQGVAVIERHDPSRRGKGFALQFGLAHLASDPPDVVLIVDADCEVHPDLVQRLAREVAATGQPAQAFYRFQAPQGSGTLNAVSQLALLFRGYIRPLGAKRLGAPCSLYGTGMAFPWKALSEVPFGGDHLVEDMQLGIDLMLSGYRPRFCPEVEVGSELPVTTQGFMSQRTRWEQGHLQTLVSQTPKLLMAAVGQRSMSLVWAALDLMVPPLALLVMLWTGAAVLAAGCLMLGVGHAAAAILISAGLMFATAIVTGWLRFCRRDVPWRVLVCTPLYVIRKIPLYWRILSRPQRNWIRTPRDAASH